MHPVRPFGALLALRLGAGKDGAVRRVADAGLWSRLDVARVRRARLIAAVDTLPELDAGDWAVLAGLNNLIQQRTNHELAGALTRGRYGRLVANMRWLCERIPAPRDTAGRALAARHLRACARPGAHRLGGLVVDGLGALPRRAPAVAPPGLAGDPPRPGGRAAGHAGRHAGRHRRRPRRRFRRGARALADALAAHRSGDGDAQEPRVRLVGVDAVADRHGPGRALAFRAMARQPGGAAVAVLGGRARVPEPFDEARALADRFARDGRGAEGAGELAGGERAPATVGACSRARFRTRCCLRSPSPARRPR